MDFNTNFLHRYFKGDYSRKDYLKVKTLFGNPENRDSIKKHLEKHWVNYSNETLPQGDVNFLLDKIHHKIRLEKNSSQNSRFITIFQRIAAILIIPLILTFFAIIYSQSNQNLTEIASAEIQCPMGVRTKFVLPDGTTGFLNGGSQLKYPVTFSGGRKVTLQGEAFFDVTHDKKHPFIVNTTNLEIKVLGTQFNVIAYEDATNEEIILKQGKVEISSSKGDKLEILQPNQRLVLDTKTRIYKKSDEDALQYIAWTEGKLVFRNVNIQQLANRLERWYNVNIEIEDEELLKYAFRATFINEPLDEVLKLFALTAPLTYKEEKRESTNNGIYKKRKIFFKLDRKRLSVFN